MDFNSLLVYFNIYLMKLLLLLTTGAICLLAVRNVFRYQNQVYKCQDSMDVFREVWSGNKSLYFTDIMSIVLMPMFLL